MKRLAQILPLILAAALQLLPFLRNIVTAPAASSSFAIIMRWTIGSSAAIGAFDACSGATNFFTSPTNFTGTVGVLFTNNLTILVSQGDGSALCVITTNGISTVLSDGQTTTFGMPRGLTFKFFDPNSGTSNSLYISISGTPISIGTNSFHVDLARASSVTVPGDFTIKILAASSSPPVFTNQPTSFTNLVSSNATFSVTAGGTAPLSYQWFFNTNTALLNATNASLTITNLHLANAGYYLVRVTNSAGSSNSLSALLTVWQPPVITNQPVSFTNVAGGNATFTVLAGGVPSLAYQWKFNGTTTLLNATNTSLPLTNLRASQAGTYSVTITNAGGVTNSLQATLVVTNPLPVTITAPTNNGGLFQFTFIPIVGLTNSVQTNSVLSGGS